MPVTKPLAVRYPVGLLDVGDSFFVPVLFAGGHMKQIRNQAEVLGVEVEYRAGIDAATGLYGIRVIRTR
jgi:hypothetical protein